MVKRLVGKGRPRSTRYYRWWWWYLQKKRRGSYTPPLPSGIWDNLPNKDELIFASSGDVSEDGTWLYGGPGYHCENGRMKGSAAAGNGTMYGQIDGLLTSHTFTVGDGSGTPTCTTNGRLDIANGVYVWDLKVWDGETLIADLPMICIGSGTEYSSTAGLPDCVWNPPVAVQLPSHPGVPTQYEVDPGPFYEVFTDGTGSNRANVDGFSNYENLLDNTDLTDSFWDSPSDAQLITKGELLNGYQSYVLTNNNSTSASYTRFYPLKSYLNTLEPLHVSFICGYVNSDVTRWRGGNNAGDGYAEYNFITDTLSVYDGTSGVFTNSNKTALDDGSFEISFDYTRLVTSTNTQFGFNVPAASEGASVAIAKVHYSRDGGEFIETTGAPIAGVQPAAYPDIETQCRGPIAADMLLGGIGIQGDGSRYITLDEDIVLSGDFSGVKFKCLFSTSGYSSLAGGTSTSQGIIRKSDTNALQVYISGSAYNFTTLLEQDVITLIELSRSGSDLTGVFNGVSETIPASSADITLSRLLAWGSGASVFNGISYWAEFPNNFYHMEDGQPGQAVSKVEDVKGYNHGTIIEPVAAQLPATPENPYPIQRALETAWVQTTVGPCYRMVGGFNLDKEGPELWTSPTTQTINASNYSTYDAETGICRIVSDGTSVQLSAIGAAVDGGSYDLIYTELNRIGGNLKVGSASEYTSLANGSESLEYTQAGTTITIARDSACDVTFKLSVKQKILGYSCEDMNNPGYDVDGDPIQWKANQYETFLNAGVLVQGSLGPETQALTTWKDGAWVDVPPLPFNIDDQEFYCDKGLALYNTAQDLESINDIGSVICSSYVPDYNLVKNGEFYSDLSRWTPTQWEWQEPGRAAPVHTTSNTLKQTIDMEAGDGIVVRFEYHLEAGATLYVKLGNPSGINDIVIAGPADDTYIGIETATGDTIQFAITGAATLDDWIDNVRIEKRSWNPNPFEFQDQINVEPFTLTTSFPVIISGMDDGCPVSVTDGEYDINQSDVWTSDAGVIDSGDLIRVRRQSGDFSTVVQVEFTAGTESSTFSITAREEGAEYLYDSDGNIMVDSDGNPVMKP